MDAASHHFPMLIRLVCLLLGLFVLPIAYILLCRRMRREVPNPPTLPMFFIFGTVGGYLVLFGIGPSFLSLMIGVWFLMGAFLSLIWVLLATLIKKPRTQFHRAATAASVLLLALLASTPFITGFAGLSHAGHWKDDSTNWSRAFNGASLPPGIQVIHSDYTRSPHFTYEAEYFFELNAPDDFMRAWIVQHNLNIEDPTPENVPHLTDKPSWFLPKSLAAYEMWTPGIEFDDFRIYRDRQTGSWFVADNK